LATRQFLPLKNVKLKEDGKDPSLTRKIEKNLRAIEKNTNRQLYRLQKNAQIAQFAQKNLSNLSKLSNLL